MTNSRVASRYAQSLIELAQERNQLEEIKADVDTLLAMGKNREFALLLRSPVVPPSKKQAILTQLLEKAKADKLTRLYVKLLIDKGRETDMLGILREFHEQYKRLKHISTVTLTSAAPLSAATLEIIKQQLVSAGMTEDSIELHTQIDTSLIGGFILEFDGKVYDASVAHKLKNMQDELRKPNLYQNQLAS
ncbi:F-type H+-transporting ATPase subunit delta [Lewinella marina]|uniref:ATP synthase subunit delta n=1 Tax=Neolewinella marina TaxID=438751 RepID=A0A2G0CI99_9BACT|nr:ATP synthase F1 subunit delta [Neolewinella marina]NJB85162.1 F-type H+-transporting ATPase subunit delta [Neolewinella marina]PHK99705.1 ATP synthase F1 subunit delta [Neolewinella marina]